MTNISDGDTITVITQERIRFYWIEAPESGQPFGRASTDHVKKVIGGAGFQVQITEMDKDRYGRIVGMVIVNGLNLNRDLVRVGLAWVYPHYCKRTECREWRELEQVPRPASWACGVYLGPCHLGNGGGGKEVKGPQSRLRCRHLPERVTA